MILSCDILYPTHLCLPLGNCTLGLICAAC
jgi:hypothetical protein